ncbi:hypothetical protein MNBD_GAMMA09-3355 [hydrothermal vent metagenome]|uniref:Uncharacterized protein n=1 Tax=hydrothermal vent metagenome TaxID=652676 RepID=A0A3B0YJP8_9ZZZZ
MEYIIELVLANTDNVISRGYILPVLLFVSVVSGVTGIMMKKFGTQARETGAMINGMLVFIIISFIFFWNLKFFGFSVLAYILGINIFLVVYLVYKSRPYFKNLDEFSKNGIVLGPPIKADKTHRIQLDGCQLVMLLPEQNSFKQNNFRGTEVQTDKYQSADYLMPEEKIFFVQKWHYFNPKGDSISEVELDVSVQKMQDYAPLNNVMNLNLAASHYLFSKFMHPRDYRVFEGSSKTVLLNWKNSYLKGCNVISYQLNNGRAYQYQNVLHIAIGDGLMLTLNAKCNYHSDWLGQLCDGFVKMILSEWKLELFENEHKQEDMSGNKVFSPAFDAFEFILPESGEYKVELRSRAKDPLEWFVFENSDVYYPWFENQYEKIEKEYDEKIQAYIRNSISLLLQKRSSGDNK